MQPEDFDVIEYLEDRDIEYRTSGKNVTAGWAEINCPFCGGDPSFHFGINIDSGIGHCWICGKKAGPTNLIMSLEGCSYSEADMILQQFPKDISIAPKEKFVPAEEIPWPKYMTEEMPNIHRQYLLSRNFDPQFLHNKYQLKYVYNWGPWKFRIIIPVFEQGLPVAFTSRAVTNNAPIKYLHLKATDSIVPVKHTLYNIDRAKDKVILVEGVFDVWRIGDGAVASYGTQLTTEQKNLLTQFDSVFILFDSDAISKANQLAGTIDNYVKYVEVIELSEGDPAELSEEEVIELKRILE